MKQQGPRADHFFTTKHTKIWKVGASKSLAVGRSRQAVDSYIADLRASTELKMDLKIFHMHRNSIPQERIGTRLGIIQRTVSKHLEKMPTLANVLNTDLTKGFTVPQVAEKYRWPIFDPPASPEGEADGGQVRLILKSNQITTILTAYQECPNTF